MDYAKTIYGLSFGVGKSDAGSHVMAGYQTPAGVNTAEDVKKLQTQLGVRADGIWGKETDGAYRQWNDRAAAKDAVSENTGYAAKGQFLQDGLTKGTVPSLTYISPLQSKITGMEYITGIEDGKPVWKVIDKRPATKELAGQLKHMGVPGKQRQQAAFYLDAPHKSGKYTYPHINIKNKAYISEAQRTIVDKLEHKEIPKGVYDALSDGGKVVKAVKYGGKALAAVGVAMDVYDVGTAVYADLNDADKKIGKKTAAAAGGAVLGWAGGALGAKAGAMGGAAIGTAILPGLGTVIGGFVGGLVGGIAGSIVGRGVSNTVVDAIDWEEDQ